MKRMMAIIGARLMLCLLHLFTGYPGTACLAQSRASGTDTSKPLPKPEMFTSGFIDIVNNGQVNASARFIRLNIGEQGKFHLPLSIYGGVSNNTFNGQNTAGLTQRDNSHLISQYINPLSGLINISLEGILFPGKKIAVTRAGLMYQLGERLLTGTRTGEFSNPQTGKPHNFLNSFAAGGIYFQTGAWERSQAKNVGIFWIALRYITCYSSTKSIQEFLPAVSTNGLYHGYCIGFGVEINNILNIKALFYRYIKKPEIDYNLPIYQFTFNYSLRH